MKITETIKKRKSSRTYNQEYLKPEDKKALEEFISLNNKGLEGETIDLFILEKREGEKKMKLAYGAIKGHNTYFLGKAKDNPATRLNYGYLMEKLVLKATELGVSTCWVGYFDHDYFNDLEIGEGFVIPGLVVVGYAAEKTTLVERFMRNAVNASQRLPWDKLFFNYSSSAPLLPETLNMYDVAKSYEESLEMLRLAPSSSNSQPWRIFFDESANEFHFYKKPKSKIYENMGMHELDLGIAMAHFELTSLSKGLTGVWTKHPKEQVTAFEELQYMISWKCE